MIRVILVAAYASVRAGLDALLAGLPDCEIVARLSVAGELERLLPETHTNVILLDALPGDVADVTPVLAGTEVGLALLSEETEDGLGLSRAGLNGWAWLRKDSEGPEIIGAVRAVSAGLVAVDPALLPRLLSGMGASPQSALSDPDPLTAREREVLQLMAQGLPNKQIATRLSVSLHTAKFHVASVLAKFGATSRTEAVTQGVRRGYVLL